LLLAARDASRYLPIATVTLALVAGWSATTSTLAIIASVDVGLQPVEVGLLASGFGLSTTVLSLPLGRLSDRVGRRRALLIGEAGLTVAMLGFGWFNSFGLLFAAVMLNGAGWSLTNPARVALLSDLVPAGRQGLAMGWIGAVEDAGMVLGGGLAGVLLTQTGRLPTFVVFSLLILASAGLTILTVHEREWRREPGLARRETSGEAV
jgi:MFS family permease